MKKTLINIYLIIILSTLLLGCSNTHSHDYIDGVCECGETIIHIHQFINEKCECGAKGPHTHSYINGICVCGEYDTNYIKKHTHVYKDGICSCGEKEINHIHTYKYGICECGKYQKHTHKYLNDNYRVCYCGYIDKHVHNYIEGKCSCGIKEDKDDINIIDFLSNDYEIKYIQDYEYIFNYQTVTLYYQPSYNISYNKLIDWLLNEINVPSVAIENFDENDFLMIKENCGIKDLDYFHYDYLVYLKFWCKSIVYVTIYENGHIIWYNPQDRKEYISIEKVDYYKIMYEIESFRWRGFVK